MAIKVQGQLTPHFSIEEYAVSCPNSIVTISPKSLKFLDIFEQFRVAVKRKIYPTSFFRTPAVNKKLKGIPNSNHLKGMACDFHYAVPITENMARKHMRMWRDLCSANGVVGEAGLYPWGMHFGIQEGAISFYAWDSRSGVQKTFKI